MPARRRRKTSRRRSKVMFRVMPALESYMIANVATQNLMGGNPMQVLLGDLNATATGSGTLAQLMGPQPGVLTIKELLTGEANAWSGSVGGMQTQYLPTSGVGVSGPAGMANVTGGSIVTHSDSPIEIVTHNFKQNIGNIIIGTTLTTAGFRIANKVLRKPKSKMNRLLKDVGLGTTVQL